MSGMDETSRPSDPMAEIDGVARDVTESWPVNAEDALRVELSSLWCDLAAARRYAFNGVWSIGCATTVDRIMGLTRVVGPTPAVGVPADLVVDGWYERIHAAIDVDAPVSDEDMAEIRGIYARYFVKAHLAPVRDQP